MKKQMMNMFVLFLLCLLSACGINDKEQSSVYRTLDDLSGKKVAVFTGCFQEAIVEKEYPEVKVMRIDSPADMVQALLSKQCEAFVMEDYNIRYYLPSVKGLYILPEKMITTEMGVCFEKGKNVELREQFNAFLAQIKADGTYDEICDRWLNHADEAEMPVITFDEKAEPIRVATSSTAPPLDFIKDGELVGLDIELMTRFAASIGRRIIWSDMNFAALMPALVSGTQDVVIAGMNITPQRAQSIDFSDPYFRCSTHVVVREENSADYQDKKQLPVYRTLEDLSGKKIAALTGCFQEVLIEKEYPELEVLRVDNHADALQALLAKRCEAIVMDDYLFIYHSQSVNGGLATLPEPLVTLELGACFGKDKNVGLRKQFNAFLAQIKADGTYDEIYDRWINHGKEAKMPEITVDQTAEPIRIATFSSAPPLVFIKDGKLVGFDVELVTRFAASIGRSVLWSDMNFGALIPALVSGKQDMALAGITITPERTQSIDFSDPYYVCGTTIGIRAENSADYQNNEQVDSERFWEVIKKSFYRNIIEENRYLMIVDAFKLTALIALLSALLGTLLGGFVCWMRMCRNALIRRIAIFYIGLMRGMPILVLLMLMFYVVFAGTSVDAVVVSIITFAMNFAAYVSEMFRSSIEGVDKGQTEAGIALGFTPVKTFYHIVMPQAFKQVLPVYKGELISLVKMTSIVGYIAVQDLTKVGDIIRSRTFDAFFPLLMVAILYFLLSWVFALVLDFIGRKAR